MITLKSAINNAKLIHPNYDIYSCFEAPDMYVFSMGPKNQKMFWEDGWVCIDKKTGEEVYGRSFSSPDDFINVVPIDINN